MKPTFASEGHHVAIPGRGHQHQDIGRDHHHHQYNGRGHQHQDNGLDDQDSGDRDQDGDGDGQSVMMTTWAVVMLTSTFASPPRSWSPDGSWLAFPIALQLLQEPQTSARKEVSV